MDKISFIDDYKNHIHEFLIAFIAIVSFFIFITIFTYIYFANTIVSDNLIMNKNNTGLILLDRNEKVFFNFFQVKRKVFVPISSISINAQNAIIVMEDSDFYSHPGFSLRGIARSIIRNIESNGINYGGSTITQQLVKNSLLSPQKDFIRKFQELVLSIEIERRYDKKHILEMYLNSIYFGEGVFGIEEAAQTYFGISAKDLTVAQSSMLAAILPAPSKLSPVSGDLVEAKIRQKMILERMYTFGYITKEQKIAAEKENLIFNPIEGLNSYAPHFALMVRDELINKYGEEYVSRSGFVVKTTLMSDWQLRSEDILKQSIERLINNNASNGAIVVIDPKNGELLALVGSSDWYNEQFGKVNMAIVPRQPGSSFKPILYATAFENREIISSTVIPDIPTIFEGNYIPQNFDGRFRGPVLPRKALSNSLNIPAVWVISKVGVEDTIVSARNFGITTYTNPSNYGLSLALGAGEVKLTELTNAYAVFANNGYRNELTTILSVKDKYGNVIYEYKQNPIQVISEESAFLISSILSDNNARAEVFGNTLTISRPAAVKTGTTDNSKDAWTIGYTPSVVVGVWVGNNDTSPMDSVAGGSGAAPIWRSTMEEVLLHTPVEAFNKPDDIVTKYISRNTGNAIQTATTSGYTEYFVSGTEPLDPPLSISPSPDIPSPDLENFDEFDEEKIEDQEFLN